MSHLLHAEKYRDRAQYYRRLGTRSPVQETGKLLLELASEYEDLAGHLESRPKSARPSTVG